MPALVRAIILLILAIIPAVTQQPLNKKLHSDPSSPSVERFPLREIRIKGNKYFPTRVIIDATGLELNQLVADTDFRRAISKLRDSGAFEAYEYRFVPHEGGYRVTFTLQEVSPLYPLRVEGFGTSDKNLKSLLKEKVPLLGKMVPATGPMIERIGAVLGNFWSSTGNRSEVVGRLAPFGDGQFEMLFSPRSEIKTIAFSTFENTGELSSLDLQRVFNQIAIGVPYSEHRVKEMLHYNIRPLYEEQGRLEVTFCPCRVQPDPNSEGLLVSIEVRQGELYTFNSLKLMENSAIHHTLFAPFLKITKGENADLGRVRKTIAAIVGLLKADGFMNALGSFHTKLDTEAKTADVMVQLKLGDRYTFNQLSVKGLDIVGESAIRKRWAINFGDPFNANYPQKFLNRITREGMFDNLSKSDWKMNINSETNTVDVTLIFN